MVGKHLATAILVILQAGTAAAGNPGLMYCYGGRAAGCHIVEIRYEDVRGDESMATFDYDRNHRPTVAVWESPSTSRCAIERYYYDSYGYLNRRVRTFSDSLVIEEEFRYDAGGLPVLEIWTGSDGTVGRTSHEYGDDGRPRRSLCAGYRGWFSGELRYAYAGDRVSSADVYEDGAKRGRIEYEYDGTGRLIRENWLMDDGRRWAAAISYECAVEPPLPAYTSANVFIIHRDVYGISREDYTFSGESGGPSYYGYEPDGKLVDKKYVRSDGLETLTAFLYDSRKRLTKSYRAYADGRCGVFTYEFDEAGRLVDRTLWITDGQTAKENYIYDDEGRLAEARWDGFDTWLTGVITFEYEGNLLSKGRFEGEDGFDAVITFGHDNSNHLTSIHWEFTFGKFQTYTFEYAPLEELPGPFALTRGVARSAPEEANQPEGAKTPVVFACSVWWPVQLERAYGLAESIRAFGGRYRYAPIWIFGPKELTAGSDDARDRFASIGAELKSCEIPDDAAWYFLSGMVFSAAEAERLASGRAKILVFLGSDTIVLREPSQFDLPEGVSLGYCPVMHKNISPLYSEPLDTYWSSAYSTMNIDESMLFPMITPADGDTIRPYFNAGCLSVRPERALFGTWAATFRDLCRDPVIREEAEQDQLKRVFTFQVALTGTFLNALDRGEMVELSADYNYPIFFKEMYGAKKNFHDISNAVTVRYEQFFDDPPPGWDEQLKGPADRIAWIKEHYTKK